MKRVSTVLVAMLCAATAIFADAPFRNHRYDAFKVLPVDSAQTVFIGNSITNMNEWWEAFGDHSVVNRGVSGAITDEALENIEAIAVGKPKKVFIMMGTNDLGTAGICTPEHVLQNITLMVERLQKVSPETELYIQSLLPSGHLGSGGTRTPERLQATNAALRAFCEEKDITYIDLWNELQEVATNSNDMSYDKLHLTAKAYKVWCDKVAPYVKDDHNATSAYTDAVQQNGEKTDSYGMRTTVFSKLPVDSTDILIIGDEMIHGGEWHELLRSARVKSRGTAWGYPGPSVVDLQKMIEPIFHDGAKPAQVFLYAGVGPVNGNTELQTIITNYKSVVAKIKELSPKTIVTLMSLQPTPDSTKNKNRVVPFNTTIKNYADESTTDSIEYLDIYTDFVSNGVANTAYFTGDYLYGKGYVKVAQKIEAKIKELEPTAEVNAITDEEANELYTRFTNRTTLGKAIVTASLLPEGDGVGQYTTANLAGVKAQIESAYTALKNGDAPSITTNAEAFTTAVNQVLPKINQPIYSTVEDTVWYQLSTPNRGSRYLTSRGAGQGVYGDEKHNYATGMWKFVDRGNGVVDIINRNDSSYLAPTAAYNAQITTSTTQPSTGWTLSYSNTPGLFIVSSGTVQLNQTQSAQEYKVYNWSANQSGSDRGDIGCQYMVTLVEGEPDEMPDPSLMTLTLTTTEFESASGKSTWTKNVSSDDAWYGKFVTGTTPTVTVESTDKTINNMGWSQKRPWLKTGYSYTISLPEGYEIIEYELTTLQGDSFNGTFTYTTADSTATSASQNDTEQTVKAKGLSTQTITLKVGEGVDGIKGIMITKMIIRYKRLAGTEELVYTIDKTNGNLYRGDATNQNWNSAWKSNATPQLQFGCGANNMNWQDNNVQLMTGTAGSATYTLSAPGGYVITEYSFTFANNNHDTALTLTMDNGTAKQTSTTAQTISAKNIKLSSVAFTLAGENGKGVVLTNFTVKVKEDKVEGPAISTEDSICWYYITSAAANKNYCNGKVMYYDSEMKKMRFGEKKFSAEYIWSFWQGENGKLAIKNYKGEYFGTAPGGTGGNTTFGVVSEPNYIYNINSAHGFFVIKDDKVEFHAQESGSSIVRWGAEAGGASLWKFDEVDTSHSMAELTSTRVEQGKISTGIGNTDQPIIRSTIRVSGLEGSVKFQGVKGRYTGTDMADVACVKVYFATNARELFIDPQKKMTWREENGEQYGVTVGLAEDGTFMITSDKELAPGDHYLWIVFDVAEKAKEGNLVDAAITSYIIDDQEVAESNGDPQYGATIFLSEGAVLMPMDKGSLYYRIPSITVTKDGKRLVTLTDDRKQHNADLPSHCYLVAQYSEDNGKTWSDPVTVAGTETTGGDYGHGDASIVTNRDNGEIVGIMTSAGTYGHGFFAGTSEQPPRWKTITSRDGGLTWETPVDHTDDLFGANCSNENTKTWKSGFSGSGAALQKRDGTLVSSFVNRQADNSQHFYFFMSKDGGKSWYVSGTSGTSSADEPKTLERNNGDLAISVRASGYNFHNVTSDDGATWKYPSQTRFTTGISGNACDGEYMVWCSTVEGNPWDIALQTLPNSGSRQNVSIALSTDEGETFGTPKTICPRGSAYSATVVLPDGTLGVYYEENGLFGGFTMRFVRFSLDWASDGKYKFTNDAPFYPIKSTNPAGIECLESIDNSGKTTVFYDLQGRQVTNPTKGIYIVNGRKVVIK